MEYINILESLKKYGTNKEDIIKRRGFENILDNVVVAPWWEHTMFENVSAKIDKVGNKVYNIYGDNFAFSFIEMKNIGAPALIDEILGLGVTNCKKILFIGSAGALDSSMKIGDLIVPAYSYNGVGACRYLNDNLEDDFEKKEYPDNNFNKELLEVIKNKGYEVKEAINYSVDCIFAQFPHIEHIRSLKAQTIEMETSTLFRCANIAKIPASALFCVSDNTVENKSLYSGRNVEEKQRRHYVRNIVIPHIISELFKK